MGTFWDLETARRWHHYSPGLAIALSTVIPVSVPVLDLGCGCGTYLAELARRGYDCLGVEGTPGIASIADFPRIVEADLSRPLDLNWPKSSILSLEVAEHLEPEAEPQFLATIDRWCHEWLVTSWAIPGQRGIGHRNCRTNTYVYDQFISRDFHFQPRETFMLRDASDANTPWFKNTLFVFRR